MLKQRINKVVVGMVVVAVVTGSSGIVGVDLLELGTMSEVPTCRNGGSQGGGC
ncbi:MAG: hypothetical protein KDI79_11430 [Anaerolineae bacterium]|nr:hypothetical protein [Anaerolineae bacterium]